MIDFILEALRKTPWWVFALFAYLVVLGVKALKERTLPLRKIFIVPALFTIWSLYSLITKFHLNIYLSPIWGLAVLVGYFASWHLSLRIRIRADKKKHLITLPASCVPLISFLLIFSAKYFFGFLYATDPQAKFNVAFLGTDLAISGLINGIFVGKLLALIHKYKTTPHTDIS